MSDDMYENDADRDAAADYGYDDPQHMGNYYYGDEEDEDENDDDEYVREGTYEGKKFPPQPKDWKEIPSTQLPHVTFDMARRELWKHGKSEIEFLLDKIAELHNKFGHDDDLENVVELLSNRDSDLYQAFRKIVNKKTDHEEFSSWLSTFLYSSRRSENFRKLCKDKRIDVTDFMNDKKYDEIWRRIRDYGKGSNVHKRAWELFQNSFNSTMKENFMPDRKKDKIKAQLCADDDKGQC